MILNTDYVIVSSEIFGVIISIILLIATIFEKYKRTRNTIFMSCLIVIIIASIFDICNYVFQGNASLNKLLYITNLGANVFGDLLLATSCAYCYSLVKEGDNPPKTNLYIIFGIVFLDIIYQIIGCITGLTFTIENGYLVTTDYYDYSYIAMFLSTIICDIFLFIKRKFIGKKSILIILLHNLMLISATTIMLINPDLYLLLAAVSISFVIIYIGIEKEKTEQLMNDMIYRDPLTGLLNRNAYNETIRKYKENNNDVVIYYIDLNGLKNANDTQGHEEGDKIINDLSNKLLGLFNDNVYRIGGDEFVVIVDYDINNNENILKSLDDITNNGDIASCGFCHKNGIEIEDAIKQADKIMQQNKTSYYITNNIERRKGERRKEDNAVSKS